MTHDELKPCPFCGGQAILRRWKRYDGGYMECCAQVRCGSILCGARSYEAHECMTQEEVDAIAIAAWNRRADS